MVQAAPDLQHAPHVDAGEDEPYISPTRGGGNAGHAIGIVVAMGAAPFISLSLAFGLVAGGSGYMWWMWVVGALVAAPAALLFLGAVFLAEHGLDLDEPLE